MFFDMPAYGTVYYTLLARIVFGHYLPGQRLPSRSQLAQEFGVGEATARRALACLVQRGYVSMHSGSTPVVRYQPDDHAFQEQMAQEYARCRDAVLDILESLCIVLPSFLHLGLSQMERPEKVALYKKMQALLKQETTVFEQRSSKLIMLILAKTSNQTVLYYYTTTQLYLQLRLYAPGGAQGRERLANLHHRLFCWLLHTLRWELTASGKIRSYHLSAGLRWYVDAVIDALDLRKQAEEACGAWSIYANYEPKYLEFGFYLIEKIYSGEFRAGDFLPSDTAAAERYQMAPMTVRKAYQLLSDLGFVNAVPKVGTQVISGSGSSQELPEVKKIVQTARTFVCAADFLDILMFLKGCIRSVALCAWKDREALQTDVLALGRSHASTWESFQLLSFVSLLDCVVRHTGNRTLHQYLRQYKPLLFFGLYCLRQENKDSRKLFVDVWELARYLQQDGVKRFAGKLAEIVGQLADYVKTHYEIPAPEPSLLLDTLLEER